MSFSVPEMRKLKQMYELINFKGDPKALEVAEIIVDAWNKYENDEKGEIVNGHLNIEKAPEQFDLPLEATEGGEASNGH